MALRLTNIRVALQRQTHGKDDAGFLQEGREPVGFMRVDLYPLTGDQVARFSAMGFDADWRALVHRPKPEVRDGDYVVTLAPDGSDQQVFRVTKKVQRGIKQDLSLREVGAEQPAEEPTGDGF